MVNDTPPVPDDDDEGTMTPDDLDFTQHDEVEDLGGGRYLIETDGPITADEPSLSDRNNDDDEESVETVYAVNGTIIAGEHRADIKINSNDVVEVFDELLETYADAVDSDMSTEDALKLLLLESKHGQD